MCGHQVFLECISVSIYQTVQTNRSWSWRMTVAWWARLPHAATLFQSECQKQFKGMSQRTTFACHTVLQCLSLKLLCRPMKSLSDAGQCTSSTQFRVFSLLALIVAQAEDRPDLLGLARLRATLHDPQSHWCAPHWTWHQFSPSILPYLQAWITFARCPLSCADERSQPKCHCAPWIKCLSDGCLSTDL